MSSEVMNDTGFDHREADEMPLHELWREDYETHGRSVVSPGFWALAVHRLAERRTRTPKLAQKPLTAVHKVLSTAVDWVWGIRVPEHTRVGRRVHIWHFGSLLLNARSIGNDVHIRHVFEYLQAHGPLDGDDGVVVEARHICLAVAG